MPNPNHDDRGRFAPSPGGATNASKDDMMAFIAASHARRSASHAAQSQRQSSLASALANAQTRFHAGQSTLHEVGAYRVTTGVSPIDRQRVFRVERGTTVVRELASATTGSPMQSPTRRIKDLIAYTEELHANGGTQDTPRVSRYTLPDTDVYSSNPTERSLAIESRKKARSAWVAANPLPPLTGSEKQRTYAENIHVRDDVLSAIEATRTRLLEESRQERVAVTPHIDSELERFDTIVDHIRQRTDAGWWLDQRVSQSSVQGDKREMIERYAEAHPESLMPRTPHPVAPLHSAALPPSLQSPPKLTGSEKQIAWAEQIRRKNIAAYKQHPTDARTAEAAERLFRTTSASYWINRRNDTIEALLHDELA